MILLFRGVLLGIRYVFRGPGYSFFKIFFADRAFCDLTDRA